MRKSILITATFLLSGCVTVYASGGETITQNRDLPAFDKLEASRGVTVTLSCGPAAKAVLRGEAEEVANIDLHVEGHTLIARRNSSWGGYHSPVHIDVTAAQMLDRLDASSGATVEAPACAASDERLDLAASSGGELKVAGKTGRLNAE